MSFIRFTNCVMNPAWIQSIEIMPTAYKIIMSNPNTSGFILFSSGFISSINKPIWITKEKDPADYEKLTKWMNQNSN